MDVFQYLNRKNVLKEMSDEDFEDFLPEFVEGLLRVGFDNIIEVYNKGLKDELQDWKDLQSKRIEMNNISSTSIVGLSSIKRNMKHIYEVKNYKGMSVKSLWKEDSLNRAVRVNRRSHNTPYISEIVRQLSFTSGSSKVTIYRPLLTKRIVEYFGAKNVLDVCVGWGGRMLGSLCVEGNSYTGIEPCKKTYEGLIKIKEKLNLKNCEIINGKAEDVELKEYYDLAITSPPYYNLEIYSEEESQSHNYGSYENWLSRFLKPTIEKVLERLKEKGISAWSVKNIKTDKKYNIYDDVVRIHKENGWKKDEIEFFVGNPIRPGKNVDSNGNVNTGQEITYIFSRNNEE